LDSEKFDFKDDFKKQMVLLREIKDIRDELHMINRILIQQKEVIEKIKLSSTCKALEPGDWTLRMDDVQRLDEDAKRVEDSVGDVRSHLLGYILIPLAQSSPGSWAEAEQLGGSQSLNKNGQRILAPR
jgi:hypothetical protein